MATVCITKTYDVDDEYVLANIPQGLSDEERLDEALDLLLEYSEWDSAIVEVFGEQISIG